MQASQSPTLVPLAFAANGAKNVIPEASQISSNPGYASLNDGFPPLTMLAVAAGGIPPLGQDFNGILNLITQSTRWDHAGGAYTYNAAFATDSNVGGYPKGAQLSRADLTGWWINTTDNNATNPDATDGSAANWVPGYNYGVTSVSGLTNANVTLSPLQAAKTRIVLTGALTGNVQIIFPTWLKDWKVTNNTTGGFTVTCKTAAGAGVACPSGVTTVVYGDGVNINFDNPTLPSLNVTGNVSAGGAINGVNNSNLQANGSGEIGVAGWSLPAAFSATVDTSGGIGTFLTNTTALAGVSGQMLAPPVSVGAGKTLSASFDVANFATAGAMRAQLTAFDSTGAYISDFAQLSIANGTALQRYQMTGVTPANTATVRWNLFIASAMTASAFGVVWRRVKVELGAAPSLYSQEASVAAALAGMATIGTVRNGTMSITAASATGTWTADEITVGTALGGQKFTLSSFNQSINLAATGAGGMDTGAAPASGYVALYAIYNPTTNARALLAVNATAAVAPEVYGGSNMPAGYTASALLGVWPTNSSSQLSVAALRDRTLYFTNLLLVNNTTVTGSITTLTSVAAGNFLPKNARLFGGNLLVQNTTASSMQISVGGGAQAQGFQTTAANLTGASAIVGAYSNVPVLTPQTVFYGTTNTAGTPTFQLGISSYAI